MAKKTVKKSPAKSAAKPSLAKPAVKKKSVVSKAAAKSAAKPSIKAAPEKKGEVKLKKVAKTPPAAKVKKVAAASSTPGNVKGERPSRLIKLFQFSLGVAGGTHPHVNLDTFINKKTVLFFYPKDDTPGCTIEGQDFSKLLSKFKSAGVQVFGVSRDSHRSHEKFQSKCSITVPLISDERDLLCRKFDVIKMKSMYGREYEGIERSTFVIDAKGEVIHEWRKVSVTGHAEEVLKFVEGLK